MSVFRRWVAAGRNDGLEDFLLRPAVRYGDSEQLDGEGIPGFSGGLLDGGLTPWRNLDLNRENRLPHRRDRRLGGRLESLERLFTHLPTDTGMAFVVLQHLSPDFKSLMDELLSRRTPMPIRQAEHDMPVEPNTVYLLPPMKEMIIRERRLLLSDRDPRHGLTLPIDLFFRSLAQDVGERAVAVVLSGSGSDGSRGVQEISSAGGVVFCESPDTAQFNGMPLSAMRDRRRRSGAAARGDRRRRSRRSASRRSRLARRRGRRRPTSAASTRSCGCCATSTASTSRTTRRAPSPAASSGASR